MRSFFISPVLLLLFSSSLWAQDSSNYVIPPQDSSINHLSGSSSYAFKDIYVSGNYSFKSSGHNYHYGSIELGYARSSLMADCRLASSSTFYVGQELGFRDEEFIHGTKVGVWASGVLIAMGLEVSHHTNYERHAFNVWPSLGFGLYPFKLSIAHRVRITGKSFRPINKWQLNVFFAAFKLKEEKL